MAKLPEDEKTLVYNFISNILLSAIKGILGLVGHSSALVADALNSFTDSITSVVVLGGVKLSKRPSDKEHQYGHGKLEAIISAFVGFSMLYAVYYIIKTVFNIFTTGNYLTPSILTAIGALVSLIIKYYLYKYTLKNGKKYNSQALIATAKDHKQDFFSTLGVLISIVSAIIGVEYNIAFLTKIEPFAALIMALVILKTSFEVLKESYMHLMDSAPTLDVFEDVKLIANKMQGVEKIDWLKGRYVGRNILLDMAIQIDGTKSISYGHEIANELENKIRKSHPRVLHVLIHVNPK